MKTHVPQLVHAQGVSFSYGSRTALEEIDFDLNKDEVVGLVGPNGSGKTTLLKILSGVFLPIIGQVEFCGRKISSLSPRERARQIAVVSQEQSFAFPFTVLEVVLMGRYPHLGGLGIEGKRDLELARKSLRLLDLQGFEDRFISELSGGEKQRVVIARAIAQEPKVLLLDEPTSSLDIQHQIQICKMMRDLAHQKNMGIVVILHDLNLAACYCDRLFVLQEGKFYASGSPDEILNGETLSSVFHAPVYVSQIKEGALPFYLPVLRE